MLWILYCRPSDLLLGSSGSKGLVHPYIPPSLALRPSPATHSLHTPTVRSFIGLCALDVLRRRKDDSRHQRHHHQDRHPSSGRQTGARLPDSHSAGGAKAEPRPRPRRSRSPSPSRGRRRLDTDSSSDGGSRGPRSTAPRRRASPSPPARGHRRRHDTDSDD